ncbi:MULTISPECIES: DUF6011 domain-containing protein [unclassified Streptomyces]|uniref:DUF6011 domain-containing protein n=1 Tax=unclassified Streptomyces TaxID=2593676 RepID=UPI00081DB26E|nr:DUF6011 domain-containing protein [Streptomyces sp. ScaeMP-e83]MYR93074.1 hypothetical protein [Streptomyces sp. SID4937]SCD46024.1 hypothetical protein GA0115243_102154 [Streptomyces sp. ScaeMP-e83]
MTDTCGVCNRPLHDAESRAAGIGPTCARKFTGGHGTAGSHQLTFEEHDMTDPKPIGRCGNDPRTVLSPGDQAVVDEFKEYLAEKRRADDAEKERDGLRRALHLLRCGMNRAKGNDFAADYVVNLIDETVAQCTGTVMEPCDADEQRARADRAETAIKRAVDQMRAYTVASGSAGVNPSQVIDLLSPSWPNGNHEAPAPRATEATS